MKTIGWIEVLWTAFALVGLGVAFVALRSVMADRRLLRKVAVNSDREQLVRLRLRFQAIFVLFYVTAVLIGGLAMTLPEPPTGRSLAGWVTVGLLLAKPALLTVATLLDLRDRNRLRRRG